VTRSGEAGTDMEIKEWNALKFCQYKLSPERRKVLLKHFESNASRR
jgi:hypothetical protein